MSIQGHNSTSRPLLGALTAPALFLASLGLAGTAQAETCSPLQVASLIPVNASIMQERGKAVGVAFQLAATVKNTNRKNVYVGNQETFFTVIAEDDTRKRQPGGDHYMRTHIAPGGSQRVLSDRIVMRKQDSHHGLSGKFEAYVFNFHCQDRKKRGSQSKFTYDLTPMLEGKRARRLSGRITGASENTPPPRGRGTPTPRGRTSSVAPRARSKKDSTRTGISYPTLQRSGS